jgi:dihydrofolate reductase
LPWRLPADLRKFRELTMGHHIIVGRKTFESIGQPLPGRQSIIVTRDKSYRANSVDESCSIVHSVEEAISLARSKGESEVFVCGGSEIYAHSLPFADRLYLTLVEAEVEADAFFPEWNESEWVEQENLSHPADEKNQYQFTFKVLARISNQEESTEQTEITEQTKTF